MGNSEKNLLDNPLARIKQLPDRVSVEWSNGLETLQLEHSFTDQTLFYGRVVSKSQALLRACSNKQRSILKILDLTGGWGIDSFILAQHGKQVTMLEQNEILYSIVSQSLFNATQQSHTQSAANRITLKHCNSIDYLSALDCDQRFDCIYLDPMFPAHKSTAKPGKAMQLLQALTGNLDIDACFELALNKANNRVVVKRPARASSISDLKPDLVYREKTIRFDVYLARR